ncbi:MAG: SDR family oxidoreductase [Phycisphaerales bacterium]|nr:MAG: SDR family oxidoreductase [Phycisphaerales bacterium]
MKLEAPVALVTGGARRVGRAIALELAGAGCDIALHFRRSQDDARATADDVAALGRRAELIQADFADPDAPRKVIESAVGAFGRLDVLVNNASVFDRMRIDEFDLQAWERTMRVNLTSPAALVAYARPWLETSGAGKIVNVCDVSADRPWPSRLAYCASKAGLVSLTRALARALAPAVQVNGVSPGIAAFPDDCDASTRRRLIDNIPLRRAGSPQDIARTVRFLAREGDYITGQIINVDGGWSIR